MDDLVVDDSKVKAIQGLHDACKYLYEEEKEVANNLNNTGKTYITVSSISLGFLGAFWKWWLFGEIPQHMKESGFEPKLFLVLLILSIVPILMTLIFSFVCMKIRKLEMLCPARQLIMEGGRAESEIAFLETMTSNYAIAAERNLKVNEEKAKWLSGASWSYVVGITLSAAGIILSLISSV